RVLRKKEDDVLYITNGKGFLFKSKISIANDKRCTVEIDKVEKQENQLKYNLHIAIAPTKNNQRLEWFLEKATEIGITTITPLICDNSERKIIKKDRLEKVLVSAMKQSNRYYLPILNEAIPIKQFMKKEFNGLKFIAHCEETEKQSLKNKLEIGKDVTMLIGPEGDFSLNEISLALANNFSPVSLGKSRLRTETAGIVATHSVAFINE
ncbi:MAG TPA: 16S rRNA (uracil(1498)-N(3))-methyltransferase, partial [Flavobacteriaceae bacterium]|nr:16S rRNA (uracil(1498)-N(3))-methyltransferase [Flavobacteriaceae bacterium]